SNYTCMPRFLLMHLPALILYAQTFGDIPTRNPHIHSRKTDGVFRPSGNLRVLPPLPNAAPRNLRRHRVLGVFWIKRAYPMPDSKHVCSSSVIPVSRCTAESAPQPTMLQAGSTSPSE
ncbi:MAG: hypothetical protein KJP16_04090, partial [Gammaproteobacteria bacterium]|nr:hypothetical protein [Gammaproteobacteria bacterium]